MTCILPFDLVELVPCPASRPGVPAAPLREIAFRGDAWLPEDIHRLRALFAADEALQAIAVGLDRTLAAIRTKIGELGLRRNSLRAWSEMEDASLAERYGHEATSAIAATFGRSPAAIYARAGLLGLTEGNPPPWTDWEIAQIRAGYTQGVPVAQLGVLIGRPVSGIATVASRLGIRHANAPDGWAAAEQQRALDLAATGIRYTAIADQLEAEGFPRREGHTVGQMLRKLGYGRGWGRPWLAEEDDLIRNAYAAGKSLTPLQERLGRTRTSIAYRAGELGLQGTHARPSGWRTEPPWTGAEIAILQRDYGLVPTPELAERLGRRKGGVFNKAWSLGLKHGYCRPFSETEEQAIRIARDCGLSLTDLSQALGRDPAVVSKHTIRMGIPFSARTARAPRGRRAGRETVTLAGILALAKPRDDVRAITPDSGTRQPTRTVPPLPPAGQQANAPPGVLILVDAQGRPNPATMPPWLLRPMLAAGLLGVMARSGTVTLLAPIAPHPAHTEDRPK